MVEVVDEAVEEVVHSAPVVVAGVVEVCVLAGFCIVERRVNLGQITDCQRW